AAHQENQNSLSEALELIETQKRHIAYLQKQLYGAKSER
ncbi:MAG: hypothetical protein ACJAVK_001959, partial [Akkermansiaceae bacterium]